MSKLKNKTANQIQITGKNKEKWDKVTDLWQKIEKTEAKCQKYEKDKKDFYEQTTHKIGEIEYQYTQLLKESIYELLKFIPYKSLNDDRFEVLSAWIDTLYAQIANNPFNVGEKRITVEDAQKEQNILLKERFKKFHAHLDVEFQNENEDGDNEFSELNDVITMLKAVIHEIYGEVPNFNKQQWLALALTPERISDIFSDPFFDIHADAENDKNAKGFFDFTEEDVEQAKQNYFEQESEADPFEQFFKRFDDFGFGSDELINQDIAAMFKSEEINKIYRQLAHKFHPDKITDEENRQHYSELMQKLTVAKKSNDIYVIIEMAIEYLPELNLDFSNETYATIVASLRYKLRTVKDKYYNQQYDNSIEGIVWRRFHQSSNKKTNKVLDDHIKFLQGRIKNVQSLFFEEKMTIKKLKTLLQQVETELTFYE